MPITVRKNGTIKYQLKQTLKRPLLPIWLQVQRSKLWQAYQTHLSLKLSPRQFQVFCIGLPKSGTHSLARMFNCRAAHEPETQILLYCYTQQMTLEEQVRILKSRDAMLWLEIESNWILGLVIEALVVAFPEAKFLLTIREPLSWMESQINQEIEIGEKIEPFASARDYMFGGKDYTDNDQILANLGHYSVAGYLSYWARQHQRILNAVPQNQLMIIPTEEITQQATAIGEYLGIKDINYNHTHIYSRSSKKIKLTELLDQDYLKEQVNTYTARVQQAINQRLRDQ